MNKMKKKRILLDGLDFIDIGLTNRKSVIKKLGNPEEFSFEDDYRVIYMYPTKGIEISIKIGHIHTSSVVTEVSIKEPYNGFALESLVLGMNFNKALESCAKEYKLDEVKKNSRVYKLDHDDLWLQIVKENDKLCFVKIYTV